MTLDELVQSMSQSRSWLAQEAGRSALSVFSQEEQAGVKSDLRSRLNALASERGYVDGEQGFTPEAAQERFRLTPANTPEGQDSRGAVDFDEAPNLNEVGGERSASLSPVRETIRGVPVRLWSDVAIMSVT